MNDIDLFSVCEKKYILYCPTQKYFYTTFLTPSLDVTFLESCFARNMVECPRDHGFLLMTKYTNGSFWRNRKHLSAVANQGSEFTHSAGLPGLAGCMASGCTPAHTVISQGRTRLGIFVLFLTGNLNPTVALSRLLQAA